MAQGQIFQRASQPLPHHPNLRSGPPPFSYNPAEEGLKHSFDGSHVKRTDSDLFAWLVKKQVSSVVIGCIFPTCFSRFLEEFDMKMLERVHWMEMKYIYHRWNTQESVKLRAFCHTRSRELLFTISLLTGSLVYNFIVRAVGGLQNKCIRRIFPPFLFLSLSPKKKNAWSQVMITPELKLHYKVTETFTDLK